MKKYILLLLFLAVLGAYNSFTPGERWNDASGNQINCHGGQVVYYNNSYYWFGEDRATGVSLYKSTDLYNWQKLTNAFSPSGSKDPNGNDAAAGRNLERPKVLYNDNSKQWVMHIHWENGDNYNDAKVMVASSANIEGPYKFVQTSRPNNHDSRDQTTFKDIDGKGYHFGSSNTNTDMLINELSTDFLSYTSKEYMSLAGKKFEAPCIWRVNETYFGIYSLCTGWDPNKGSSAYTFDLFKTWTEIGPISTDEKGSTTYDSQAAYVFKVPGYEYAYIYVGDRWISSNPKSSNTVWLPLSIRTGYPKLRWYSSWDLSVFKDVDRYKRAKSIVAGNTYLLLDKHSDRFISKSSSGSFITTNDNEIVMVKVQFEQAATNTYKIKNAGTNQYLESNSGTLREAASSTSRAQQWLFTRQSDGYYTIQNVNDNNYITANGGSNYTNTAVTLGSSSRPYAVYFDANNYDYEAANIYSASYRS